MHICIKLILYIYLNPQFFAVIRQRLCHCAPLLLHSNYNFKLSL